MHEHTCVSAKIAVPLRFHAANTTQIFHAAKHYTYRYRFPAHGGRRRVGRMGERTLFPQRGACRRTHRRGR